MDDSPAAFPCSPGDVPFWNEGMSLRDWFAGQALAGVTANPETPVQMIGLGFKGSKDLLAEYAFAAADAMLAERTKGAS